MIATAIQSDYQLPSVALQPTQVVAIGSGEGGVGKINLVINLAFALARRGEDVVILDGDLGLGNVQIALGLPFGKDLSEFLLGESARRMRFLFRDREAFGSSLAAVGGLSCLVRATSTSTSPPWCAVSLSFGAHHR